MAETDSTATRPGGPVDVSRMTPGELRAVMQWLGYEPPATMSPADLAAAAGVAGVLPREALAAALNPGTEVNFGMPLPGVGVPGVLPVSGGQNFEASGGLSLSGVRTGPGGERSQVLEMSVELQSQVGVAYGRTDLNRIYRYADRFDVLPDGIRNTVDGWSRPAQWAVRGPALPASIEYETYSGGRLSYEAVVPPEVGARIAAGDLSAAPNPLAPMSIPPGSSVVMRGDALEGSTFAASYRLLHGRESITELSGQAFGVRRLEGNLVEVTTGPSEAVEREAFLGVGLRNLNVGIGNEARLSDDRLSVARLDLGTPEGQEAYRQFMQTGLVPDRAGPGVPMAGERRQVEAQSQTSVQANLGSLSWASTLSEWRSENVTTRWSDGTAEHRISGQRPNGDAYEVASRTAADGSMEPGSRSWQVSLAGMDPATASYMRTAFSGAPYGRDLPDNATADLRFTDADLMRMRDLARAELGERNPAALSYIDARQDQPHGVRAQDATSILQRMAAANTPEEVFSASFVAPMQRTGALSETLLALSSREFQDGQPGLPGDLTVRDSNGAAVFTHARPAEPAPAGQGVATPHAGLAAPVAAPADAPSGADPRRVDDPDNALYRQALGAVERLDASMGRATDDASRALAASITVLAKQNNMEIDHLMLSSGNGTVGHGENVIIVDGAPNDPASRVAAMPTRVAVATPEEQSFATLGQMREQAPVVPQPQQDVVTRQQPDETVEVAAGPRR